MATAPQILAVKMRALGDTVLLTGTLRLLQSCHPDWQIDVLVPQASEPLFQNLPFVRDVIAVQEPQGIFSRFGFWLQLAQRLRGRHYDKVLVFHSTSKMGGFGQWVAGPQGLCIVNHHGLTTTNPHSDLPVPGRGEVKANIDRDLDVLRALGEAVSLLEANPELRVTAPEIAQAQTRLPVGIRSFIFLGIGASRPTKRWPAAHFVELMRRLAAQDGALQFIACTIDSDQAWLSAFETALNAAADGSALRKRLSVFHNLPLRDVLALMSLCRAYVGNDSGPKHMAVGLGLATVTIFGPENPVEWHPYSQDRHPYLFTENLSCRTASGQHWCAITECVLEKHRCMQEQAPERAAAEVSRFLSLQK